MKNKILAFLLAFHMALAVIPMTAFAKTGSTTHYACNFDSVPISNEWTSDASGFGISYVVGKWKIVQGSNTPAISGKTALFQYADMRWWNVSYKNETMSFSFQFRIDENFAGSLYFCVGSQNGATGTEGLTGKVIQIEKSGNGALLKNHKGQTVSQLENQTYQVETIFTTGSNKYEIKLNGNSLGTDHMYYGTLVSIHGIRFYIDTVGEENYIALDNFIASSYGWVPPQTYSWQEKGNVPKVTLPRLHEDRIFAYLDKTEIDLSEQNALEADGTVYLPLEKALFAANLTSSVGSVGETVVTVGEKDVALRSGQKIIRIGSDFIELNHAPKVENGVLYVPLQFFAEVLDAKVWYDAPSKTVVLTTGDYKTDNILRLYNGKFFMNGEIYYEISFNKFDLQSQIWADPKINGTGKYTSNVHNNAESCLQGAEKALKTLSENGFKTIRVFCNGINLNRNKEEVDVFFKATDAMYDLCDKYGIQVVACMGLYTEEYLDAYYLDGIWVSRNENIYDYFTNPDSVSRQNVYQYIETYVNRYKDRDTILMWEITNEGNLGADIGPIFGGATYSLMQLGQFYNDIAKKFHEVDPERLVTGGDGMLRSSQWHLFESIMTGNGNNAWTPDSSTDRKKALMLLHEELDVISIHGYDVGYETGNGHGVFVDLSESYLGITRHMTFTDYVKEAFNLGKGLYNGETGGQMAKPSPHEAPLTAQYRAEYLKTLVDGGVQLNHWWTYQSNRNGAGFNNDDTVFSVTAEKTPETFAAIKAANEELKAKWIVNAAESENTEKYKNGEFVEYKGKDLGEYKKESGCGSTMGTVIPMIFALSMPPMLLRKKKNKYN